MSPHPPPPGGNAHAFVHLDVGAIKPPMFGRSRGTVLGPLQQKSQPTSQGFVTWMEAWCALLAVIPCLSGVWCGVGAIQIQFKIIQKELIQFSLTA